MSKSRAIMICRFVLGMHLAAIIIWPYLGIAYACCFINTSTAAMITIVIAFFVFAGFAAASVPALLEEIKQLKELPEEDTDL